MKDSVAIKSFLVSIEASLYNIAVCLLYKFYVTYAVIQVLPVCFFSVTSCLTQKVIILGATEEVGLKMKPPIRPVMMSEALSGKCFYYLLL